MSSLTVDPQAPRTAIETVRLLLKAFAEVHETADREGLAGDTSSVADYAQPNSQYTPKTPEVQALAYAARGWHVIPLHTPSSGQCSCGKPDCRSSGKHPRTPHGVQDATTDAAQIRRWWKRWPDANIGIACGLSKLVVIDIDPRNGGDETWAELREQYGLDGDTVVALTGGGGTHLLYQANGTDPAALRSTLGPGVDVKHGNGYIVAPPSVHQSGHRYEWEVSCHPDDREPVPLPPSLIYLLRKDNGKDGPKAVAPAERLIPQGRRNDTLASLAGTMRRRGMTKSEISVALLKVNEDRCDPPLLPDEVERIAKSIARYDPDEVPYRPPVETSAHEAPDLEAFFTQAVEATQEDRPEALAALAKRLVDARADAFVVEGWAKRAKAAGLTTSGTFVKAVQEAQEQRVQTDQEGTKQKPQETDLPRIDAADRNLSSVTGAAWMAIWAANREPFLFRYGGLPVRIETDDNGIPFTQPVTKDRMRHTLARVATWYKVTKHGPVDALPPVHVVKDVLATPDMELPILDGIVSAPVFASDGTLQTEPGYHPKARTYYRPANRFAVSSVRQCPTGEELARARELILDDLLGDFPFTGEAERAHAVAVLLLPFVRPMIRGVTPLHLVEKPSPGTGGTLLVNALLYAAIGEPVTAMTEGNSEDEWRKRLTAKLLAGAQVVFIDNLRRPLDSAALAAAITTPVWEDRILGQSKVARIPIRCVWVATGNNPIVSDEVGRRSIRIRMDAGLDRPWRRTEFRHPDLRQWVEQNRAELVWAALTIIQNWIAHGRPAGDRTLGMFESWATTMGGILATAAIPGFQGNLDEFYEQADMNGMNWRAFVAVWWEMSGCKEVGVAELFKLIKQQCIGLDLGDGGERSQRTRLGIQLRHQRDRRYQIEVDGQKMTLQITFVGQKGRANQWRLSRTDEPMNVVNVCRGQSPGERRKRT